MNITLHIRLLVLYVKLKAHLLFTPLIDFLRLYENKPNY